MDFARAGGTINTADTPHWTRQSGWNVSRTRVKLKINGSGQFQLPRPRWHGGQLQHQ
jgi:hypothetical protein